MKAFALSAFIVLAGGSAWAPRASAAWTDPVLSTGTLVRAVHVKELRAAVEARRTNFGFSNAFWTWSIADIAPGQMLVRAPHVTELRQGLTDITAAYHAVCPVAVPLLPPWSEPIAPGVTPVRAAHFAELRAAADAIGSCAGCCGGPTACRTGACDGLGGCGNLPAGPRPGCNAPPSECVSGSGCDGLGNCNQTFQSPGTHCNNGEGQCANQDTCNAIGQCVDNGVRVGAACGDQSSGPCTAPDSCGSDGNCDSNDAPGGTACGCHGWGSCQGGGCDAPQCCNDGNCTNNSACGGCNRGSCEASPSGTNCGFCMDCNPHGNGTSDCGFVGGGADTGNDCPRGECDGDNCDGNGNCEVNAGGHCGTCGTCDSGGGCNEAECCGARQCPTPACQACNGGSCEPARDGQCCGFRQYCQNGGCVGSPSGVCGP